MIADKLNTEHLFELISNEGIGRLGDVARSIVGALHDVGIDECEAQIAGSIALKARRFGKGAALLGPFGYFHPSEIISVIADNAKRGRLSKKEDGSLYTYDFYPNGEVAMIAVPCNSTKTFCEHVGNVKAYLTYEMLKDGSNEIAYVTLARYGENGLLEIMIQFVLIDSMKTVLEINGEMYDAFEANKRICHLFTVGLADESCTIYKCFKCAYEVSYSDDLKIIDYECLPSEGMSQITL